MLPCYPRQRHNKLQCVRPLYNPGMNAREPSPDVLIMGAAKGGNECPVREDYTALFRGAPEDALRLESTPFYLSMPNAGRRIVEELPNAKLIVIVRDPINRAYSNWMHLCVDGLEPLADFVEAWHAEDSRVAAGWAPFWHYRRLGRYGEQLADLLSHVERERVLVLRYWQLVSQPSETFHQVARFLGVGDHHVSTIPPDNARPRFSRPTSQTGLKLTPSTDLATTTPTPRPMPRGRRRRYAIQNVPFTKTQLAPPAQFPGP